MWCEKLCTIHKNPINCILHLIAGIILVYALWFHNIKLIVVAIIIAIIGHIIQAITKKPVEVKRKR